MKVCLLLVLLGAVGLWANDRLNQPKPNKVKDLGAFWGVEPDDLKKDKQILTPCAPIDNCAVVEAEFSW